MPCLREWANFATAQEDGKTGFIYMPLKSRSKKKLLVSYARVVGLQKATMIGMAHNTLQLAAEGSEASPSWSHCVRKCYVGIWNTWRVFEDD